MSFSVRRKTGGCRDFLRSARSRVLEGSEVEDLEGSHPELLARGERPTFSRGSSKEPSDKKHMMGFECWVDSHRAYTQTKKQKQHRNKSASLVF